MLRLLSGRNIYGSGWSRCWSNVARCKRGLLAWMQEFWRSSKSGRPFHNGAYVAVDYRTKKTMHLKPCYNCPHKDGCEIKAEKRAALRGLGFTSAKFKCEKHLSTLPPGQRITLLIGDAWEEDCPGKPHLEDEEHTATVMGPSKGRILVWLDEVTIIDRNPIRVRPDRVTPLPERVSVCKECGQPEGTKARDEWFCQSCVERPLPSPKSPFQIVGSSGDWDAAGRVW